MVQHRRLAMGWKRKLCFAFLIAFFSLQGSGCFTVPNGNVEKAFFAQMPVVFLSLQFRLKNSRWPKNTRELKTLTHGKDFKWDDQNYVLSVDKDFNLKISYRDKETRIQTELEIDSEGTVIGVSMRDPAGLGMPEPLKKGRTGWE
jgi:hypothetical protein